MAKWTMTFQHLNTSKSDSHISFKGLGSHTPILVLCYSCMHEHDCADILETMMLVHVSYNKMGLQRYSTYHLKAHRISNNMVLKLPVQSLLLFEM